MGFSLNLRINIYLLNFRLNCRHKLKSSFYGIQNRKPRQTPYLFINIYILKRMYSSQRFIYPLQWFQERSWRVLKKFPYVIKEDGPDELYLRTEFLNHLLFSGGTWRISKIKREKGPSHWKNLWCWNQEEWLLVLKIFIPLIRLYQDFVRLWFRLNFRWRT